MTSRIAAVEFVPNSYGDRTVIGMRKRGGNFKQHSICRPQLPRRGDSFG
jgi:hypothetical protein